MKHKPIRGRLSSLAGIAALCLSAVSGVANAVWDDKVRAFAFLPSNQTSMCTEGFFQSVRNLRSMGANQVTIVLAYSQSDLNTNDIFPYSRTPSDEALACGIEFIQSQGMQFGMNFVVNGPFWRANIDPNDRDIWFPRYGELATRYARDFAQRYGARHFSIGTEMYKTVSHAYSSQNIDTPSNYRWGDIINDVRSVYSGTITYSAQHSGNRSAIQENNDIMGNVDVLGLSAYFQLFARDPAGLQAEWARIDRQHITPAQNRYGKDVWITELGYRPCDSAYERPFESGVPCAYNAGAQVATWDAFLTYFGNRSNFRGLLGGWAWEDNPNIGGEGDTRYTPWNKPAADTFRSFWPVVSGGTTAPAPQPAPQPAPAPAPAPTMVTPSASNIMVSGSTISWPDDGYYQVQSEADFSTQCEGGRSCDVAAGSYVVINLTTGQRFAGISVTASGGGQTPMVNNDGNNNNGGGNAGVTSVTVSGNTISWPDDGYYQVQSEGNFSTVCEAGTSCDVSNGSYVVINLTTGQRFSGIQVGGGGNNGRNAGGGNTGGNAGVTAVTVDGNTIRWPDDGYYQVQNTANFSTVCEGTTFCDVSNGTYVVINLTTGQRFNDIVVGGSNPQPSNGNTNQGATVTAVTVNGNTISWPDDGYYQVQSEANFNTVCEAGRSCDVSNGSYVVINLTTGQRFAGIQVGGAAGGNNGGNTGGASPSGINVSGNTISWPDDGYYQVQSAVDFLTVCEGGSSCDVATGSYVVINLTSQQRFNDIMVGGGGNGSTEASGDFPFGESQFPGVPYCDPSETNVPDHGWGDLSNYGFSSRGCIHPGGNADNPSGDSNRGFQP